MADEQIAARLEIVAELAEQCGLGRPVKIDYHVAAEDDVLLMGEFEVLHEIKPLERYLVAKDRIHFDQFLVLGFEHVLFLVLHGHVIHLLNGIDGVAGFREDLLGNVGGKDGKFEAVVRGGPFVEDHAQRVRFFSAGTPCRPYSQIAVSPDATTPEFRQNRIVHDIPMLGLTEKMCGVGCDDVDEVGSFLFSTLVGKNVVAILFVRGHSQNTEAFLKAALQEHAFGRRHLDAEFGVDEFAETFEFGIAHLGLIDLHGFIHSLPGVDPVFGAAFRRTVALLTSYSPCVREACCS